MKNQRIAATDVDHLDSKRKTNTDDNCCSGDATKQDSMMRCNIRKSISPLIISLQIVGLYRFNCLGSSKATRLGKFLKIYSIAILTFQWLNFARSFSMYNTNDKLNSEMLLNINSQLFYVECAIGSTLCYMLCRPGKGWNIFFETWIKTTKCLQQPSFQSYLRKTVGVFVATTWIFILLNVAFSLYAIFATEVMDQIISPIPSDYPYHIYILCASMILQVYTICAWIFPISIVFFLSLAIYMEFKLFHQDFQKIISDSGELKGDFEEFRVRHQKICRLAGVVDDMLNKYSGIIGGLSMMQGMLVMSILFWHAPIRSNPVMITMSFIWLSGAFLTMALIFIGGGIVNTMAHAPIENVHDIRVKNCSPDLAININMFLSRLSGGPIGLTAYRMFVIDKTSLLSIVGVFTTYFIILVQFQQSGTVFDTPEPSSAAMTTVSPFNVTKFS